jgi:hypothetical protein
LSWKKNDAGRFDVTGVYGETSEKLEGCTVHHNWDGLDRFGRRMPTYVVRGGAM